MRPGRLSQQPVLWIEVPGSTPIRITDRDIRIPGSEFDAAVARGEYDAAGYTRADRAAQARREAES